jgi:hypothetical protein
MKTKGLLLTPQQIADIFQISQATVEMLAKNGQIPHSIIQDMLQFNTEGISKWLQSGSILSTVQDKDFIKKLQGRYRRKFPEALDVLRELDSHIAPKRRSKGYSLHKVPSKQYGFLYYVRYIEKGKQISSRWNTHTNDRETAEQFACTNRDRILAEYGERKQEQKQDNLYQILNDYYKKGSPYLEIDRQRGRNLSGLIAGRYQNFMVHVLIPFFRTSGVTAYSDVTPPLIAKLQNHLLARDNKPQTVNQWLGCFKAILDHMVMDGVITESVFTKTTMLKRNTQHQTIRGCYEIDLVRGVFNRRWPGKISHLLCLMIYTTGLRNSEIEKIKVRDIIKIRDCRFINVRKSKTENGIRLVPLHEYVYTRIARLITRTKKHDDDYIFSEQGGPNQSGLYKQANTDMGAMLGFTPEQLAEQGISFYSGRHYWKTLMNAGDLGDIEEYFMGHKVSGDVSKRYNHRDKQGQKKLLEKAREVYRILDRRLFKS